MSDERTQLEQEDSCADEITRLAPRYNSVRMRVLNAAAILLSAILAVSALVTVEHIFDSEYESERLNEAYRSCLSAARDLQEASDYLTSQVRVYVATGNRTYMDAYLEEIESTDRRGKAVQTLKDYLGEQDAVIDLEEALSYSNQLAERELYAMKLTAEVTRLDDVPPLVAEVELSDEDRALSADQQSLLAEQIVLGDEYQSTKMQISGAVRSCSDRLLEELNDQAATSIKSMRSWLWRMQLVVVALLAILVLIILAVIVLILWPLSAYAHQIKQDEPLKFAGAYELRYLADAYNVIYYENHERTRHLRRAAERDHLTGLYNRGAYEHLLAEHAHDMALLLVDVDLFKDVNDTYGHNMGDDVLKKVASLLEGTFRASDFPCRIGGDEFAVIMTGVTPELRHVVTDKLNAVARALRDTSDGLPVVTLSIGVAFSGAHPGEDDIYKAADQALYVVKERGRNGHAFYDEVLENAQA